MGSLTTEIPASAGGTKSKHGGAESLENEAIGLDVSVRIHGSQVAAVVLDTTEHVEPFEEDTSTMIVFPRGAVVKLQARVRTGHAVVLTNLGTKQTAVCRIIQVNSTANTVHYVKLEFSQPEPGFWGVHFPSDDNAAPPAPAPESHPSFVSAGSSARISEPLATPLKPLPTEPSSPMLRTQPEVSRRQTEPKPPANEVTKEPAKLTPPPPVNYGATVDVAMNNEIVPLAAAPVKKTAAIQTAAVNVTPPPQSLASLAAETPIFDSLSTGEEIFGKEALGVLAEETNLLKADRKAAQAFGRSLDPSTLLQSVEIPKRNKGLKIFLSAAAVVIIGVGAAFYVKQYRGNTRQSAVVDAPEITTSGGSAPQSSAAPAAGSAASDSTTNAEVPIAPGPSPNTHRAVPQPPAEQDAITVTPVHNASRNAVSQSRPTISTGLANVYAGDLTARPEVTQQRRSAPLQAPLPSVSSAPGNLGATPSNTGLGSLVSGSSADNSALPKPVEPKPVVRGGVVSAPKLIHRVQPIYPALAATNRVEGDVEVEALIDQTGKVTSTKAISGPVLLRRAAMDAVRQWRYSPALLDGKPISTQYKVTVSFRIGQ